MIVDDEPAARRSASRIWRRAGYQVIEAADGRAALEHYMESEHRLDLVLLDLDMPALDGTRILRLLEGSSPKRSLGAPTGAV